MKEYEQYESECNKRRMENHLVLREFRNYLQSMNLSPKTVDKHVANVEFYINEFLLHEEPLQPREGVGMLDYFLGYWFIRKALWASVTSIKENIASLKRFYTYQYQKGEVSAEELHEMKQDIKENKDDWIETLMMYDDPDTDFEDIW